MFPPASMPSVQPSLCTNIYEALHYSDNSVGYVEQSYHYYFPGNQPVGLRTFNRFIENCAYVGINRFSLNAHYCDIMTYGRLVE